MRKSWRNILHKITIIFILFIISINLQGQQVDSSLVAIQAGRLIDTRNGSVLSDQLIMIRDGIIESVESNATPPIGVRLIDLSEMTVMPGFIDAHSHLVRAHADPDPLSALRMTAAESAFGSVPNARNTLLSGFTTVRDVGTYRALVDVAMREAIEHGYFIGPRMLVAGAFVTITGGAGSLAGASPDLTLPWDLRYGHANSVEEIRERVRTLASQRVDLIKVFASGAVLTYNSNPQARESSFEEIKAAVEEAANFGIPVVAHAHNAEAIKNAIRAGVVSIEHGSFLDEEGRDLMVENGVYLVPTLMVQDCINLDSNFPEEFVERANTVMSSAQEGVRLAVEAGVKIALGSDVPVCPVGTAAKEFDWLVRHGMTPIEAIQAGTFNGADLLGLADEIGVIEAGMLADIVAVEGDPLENIRLLENIQFVMRQGIVYKE